MPNFPAGQGRTIFVNQQEEENKTENPPIDALEIVENCSNCNVQGDQTRLTLVTR